jgi:hypothetical protein
MKKNLFFISVAMLAFSACTNDTLLEENTTANQQKEIAFQAISTPATRAAIADATFPNTKMIVAAWDTTESRLFFEPTAFNKDDETWKAGKYWPLAAAYVNFLAIANATEIDEAVWAAVNNDQAQQFKATISLQDNKLKQEDLLYAMGNGAVTKNGNSLTYPNGPVGMQFRHALGWVNFKVKAYSTVEQAIRVDSITLNGAKFAGDVTVNLANFDSNATSDPDNLWIAWDTDGVEAETAVTVPGWTAATLSQTEAAVGNGLLIVPIFDEPDFANFTIHYTLDSNHYEFVYTPGSDYRNIQAGKKYTYTITFKLNEIEVAPEVAQWDAQEATDVNIPTVVVP